MTVYVMTTDQEDRAFEVETFCCRAALEDEFTAKLLLNQGRITRRVTILPLNRLRGSTISPDEVRRMQQKVGQDKVWAAIDLVEYDPKFRIVAEYSLGKKRKEKNASQKRIQ